MSNKQIPLLFAEQFKYNFISNVLLNIFLLVPTNNIVLFIESEVTS